MQSPITGSHDDIRRGMIYGILAYGWWGLMPIYFRALEPAGSLEILAHRILWSSMFCFIYLAWRRDFAWIGRVIRHPSRVVLIVIAAHILAVNWGTYIFAVSSGNVLEASLGYFINPLMTVLVGVIVLREKLSPLQWGAIALGALAVLVISVDYGNLPWISLTLATSFTIYGYIKKTVRAGINTMQTMTIESVVLVPFAAAVLTWLRLDAGDLTFLSEGVQHTILLALIGLVSLLPLIWFGSAAVRLPFTTLGLLQFLAPIGQFIIGVFVFQEDVSQARWIGFGIVWVALVLITIDSFRQAGRRRRILRNERAHDAGRLT